MAGEPLRVLASDAWLTAHLAVADDARHAIDAGAEEVLEVLGHDLGGGARAAEDDRVHGGLEEAAGDAPGHAEVGLPQAQRRVGNGRVDHEEVPLAERGAVLLDELDRDLEQSLREGLRIARKQAAPDLIRLPLPVPPQGGQS